MHMEIINNTSMPMLEVVAIKGLKSFKVITQLSNSIHLTSLTITDCQTIESFSDLQLSNLTKLHIELCDSIESFSNLRLPNLAHLYIVYCNNVKSFRDLQMPYLTSWQIEDCQNLRSFPDLRLSNLTMLKQLWIKKCPMLDVSFPHGLWPPRLVYLEVGELKRPILEWGYQNFPPSLVHKIMW
ncbi:putative leucine-rich repeat domain superfamily [Helianthus annuus]|nr:putative leucine-rich repeat domain superfamily [Helianthus annuus]KAJ0497813.1 putative leucine-rich repeat domain superfamily [Helianthus annuus]KAJ0663822.1 putative leucine-rich repeat domain superfamily [Helianthus annuus]KAJ0671309.1 putative leucine-rich repeat domain superfamily [Helianthus annuus]KAJ0858328.1 putative leucine-rich repeat domain superfamily [Helianthus annuus]